MLFRSVIFNLTSEFRCISAFLYNTQTSRMIKSNVLLTTLNKLVTQNTSTTSQKASLLRQFSLRSYQQNAAASPIIKKKEEKQPQVKLTAYLKHVKAENQVEQEANRKFDHITNSEVKYYDPPYLIRKAPHPNYELLNINIKGYDFTSLDVFYKFVERLCLSFQVKIVEAYPMPSRSLKVKTFQPYSTNLDKEYSFNMYHRVVRIKNLKSTTAPLLFEAIQLNLPEGVQLNVSVPSRDQDEFRYVPDVELHEMRAKLEELKPKKNEEAVAAEASATTTTTSTTSPAVKK